MGFYKICGYSQQQVMALLYALGDQGKNPVSFLDKFMSLICGLSAMDRLKSVLLDQSPTFLTSEKVNIK